MVELPEQPVAERLLGLGQRVRAPSVVLPDRPASPFLARNLIVHLEHVVRLEDLPKLSPELERRELQQTNRLMHPRRHRELLSEPEIQCLLHQGRRWRSIRRRIWRRI
jgi:hypothetical protein